MTHTAARRLTVSADDRRAEVLYDLENLWLYLDPILKGGYDPLLEAELRRECG